MKLEPAGSTWPPYHSIFLSASLVLPLDCLLTFASQYRVDYTLLPLLTIGLFVFQLDRTNLGSALTGGFMQDVGIKSQNIINAGNQLMFGGIVLLEIPSNST